MNKILLSILIESLFVSCGYFGDKADLSSGINFTEEVGWLLVKTNTDLDTCGVIFDRYTLINTYDDLEIKATKECGGTTPDNCIDLYKDGDISRSICYCSWLTMSYKLGRLEKSFLPAKLKLITANSIKEHDFLLDSLNKRDNIYLLYPKDTIIEFPAQLKFDIKLVEKKQDIFEQEKQIEKVFKQIFKNGKYQVGANWYSSEVGTPRKLGYHIIVDCNSSFLKDFDSSKLKKNNLFQEMTDYKYSTKEFQIRYYEWN